jgi:hypothetical protein
MGWVWNLKSLEFIIDSIGFVVGDYSLIMKTKKGDVEIIWIISCVYLALK